MLKAIKSAAGKYAPWTVPIYRKCRHHCLRFEWMMNSCLRRLNPALRNGAGRVGPAHNPRSAVATRDIGDPRVLERLKKLIRADNAAAARPKSPAKFVVLTHALSAGGAERQWCYLARELAARGEDVTLMVFSELTGANAHYLPLLSGAAVRVRSLAGRVDPDKARSTDFKGLNVGEPVQSLAVALSEMEDAYLLCQLDSVNIHGGLAGFIAGRAVRKILFSFRNFNPSHFPRFYHPWMREYYKAFAESGRVALSGNSRAGNADYAAWLGVDRESIHYTPNAFIPPPRPAGDRLATRTQLGVAADAPLLVGAFRLADEKNPYLFVDVAAALRRRIPKLRAVHLGDGPLMEKISSYAKKCGVASCLSFLGERDDVHDIMACADLMLLCSNFEGLPNVVLEAQSAGLPVVATRAGGTADAMSEGVTGLLADVGDKEALIARCLEILLDERRRCEMAAAGPEHVRTAFTAARLCDSVLEALHRDNGGARRMGLNEK